jgi:ribosome-associated protein
MEIVEIDSQPIELCKLLKIANLVGGGGEAKIVISEGFVFLNGELETQKRKKVYDQDVVEFNGEMIQVVCHQTIADTPIKKKPKPKKQTTTTQEAPVKKGGRRRISF